MSIWTITPPEGGAPVPPKDVNLSLVSVSLADKQVDMAAFDCVVNFDTEEWYQPDQLVTLYRDGARWFEGRMPSDLREATGEREAVQIDLRGPWADLETTLFQEYIREMWVPFAAICRDSSGNPISTGATIRRVIQFAGNAGCNIQLGSVPDGVTLWAVEANNMMCAEVIRQAMRLHPDWVTRIDYSTAPPTFHIEANGGLTTRTIEIGVADLRGVNIRALSENAPDALRLVYRRVDDVDGSSVTKFAEDIFPVGASPTHRRTLSALIDLAGGTVARQISRLQVEALPQSQDDAKEFLKKRFPNLADIPDNAFNITSWDLSLVEEPPDPDPANALHPRQKPESASEVPNAIVSGTLEDWSRAKVGLVHVSCEIEPDESASSENKKLIARHAPRGFTVRCTSSPTTSYSRIISWQAGEDAPVGLAAALWPSISKVQHQGSLTIVGLDIPEEHYIATKLNILGGLESWENMDALVTGVDYNIAGGTATIQLGPQETLAPQDFVEMLRQIRSSPPTTFSFDGDTEEQSINGYYTPYFSTDPSGGAESEPVSPFGAFSRTYQVGEGVAAKWVLQGGTVRASEGSATIVDTDIGSVDSPPPDGRHVYVICNITAHKDDETLVPGCEMNSASIDSGTSLPNDDIPTDNSPSGKAHVDLGVWQGGQFRPAVTGGNIEVVHWLGALLVNRGH